MTMEPSRRAAPLVRMLWTEIAVAFLGAWRSPAFLLPTLLFPVGFYALLGLVLNRGAGVAASQLATFGLIGVIGPALFGFGVSVAAERESGALDLQRLSPLPVWGFLIARLAMCVLFGMVVLAILYGLAAGPGAVRLERSQWLWLAASQLAAAAPMGLLGLALGLRLGVQSAAGVVNVVFLVLAALGGLWLPTQLFPKVLQQFSSVLPTSHMAALSLGAIGRDAGSPWPHLAVLAAFTAAFALAAARGWTRACAR